MSGPNDVSGLRERIERLESGARRWKACALAGLGAAVLPWALGAVPEREPARELRVSSLVLVAPDGSERATLRLEGGSPVLSLREGERHASLTLADGNAGLVCGGPAGASFSGVSRDGAYFNARAADLKMGVFAGIVGGASAAFRAYGSDMRVAAELEAGANGVPVMRLSNLKKSVTELPAAR